MKKKDKKIEKEMTEISFNLLKDAWIPVKMENSDFKLTCIEDCLFNPQEILEISSDNPFAVISIYRLLLAILHRNFGPKNRREWTSMYTAGEWDKSELERYFEKWSHRFELFNEPENRFYQIKAPVIKDSIINKLDHSKSTGNMKALFDHTWDLNSKPINVEKAAQLLVISQNYGLSGLGGFLDIDGNKKRINFSHGTLVSGIVVLLKGVNLFDTLMLNLVRYDNSHPFKKSETHDDIPFWERDDKSLNEDKKGRYPYGYLDYLTWQSRRLWLIPFIEDNQIKVQNLFMANGEKIKDDWTNNNNKPQMVYKINRKSELKTLRINPNRHIWRDAEALIRLNDPKTPTKIKSPIAINWISLLVSSGVLSSQKIYNLEIFGICTDPKKAAKIISWHKSSIPLPLKYLEDQSLVNNVKNFIEKCELIDKSIYSTMFSYGKAYLYPLTDEKGGSSLSSNQRDRVRAFVKNHQLQYKYWSLIEKHFFKFLEELASENDLIKRRELVNITIKNHVVRIARSLLNSVKDNAKNDPRALKPLVQTFGYFYKQIRDLQVI